MNRRKEKIKRREGEKPKNNGGGGGGLMGKGALPLPPVGPGPAAAQAWGPSGAGTQSPDTASGAPGCVLPGSCGEHGVNEPQTEESRDHPSPSTQTVVCFTSDPHSFVFPFLGLNEPIYVPIFQTSFVWFLVFGCAMCFAGSSFPNQRLNPCPQQRKCGVLTTGLAENSLL